MWIFKYPFVSGSNTFCRRFSLKIFLYLLFVFIKKFRIIFRISCRNASCRLFVWTMWLGVGILFVWYVYLSLNCLNGYFFSLDFQFRKLSCTTKSKVAKVLFNQAKCSFKSRHTWKILSQVSSKEGEVF